MNSHPGLRFGLILLCTPFLLGISSVTQAAPLSQRVDALEKQLNSSILELQKSVDLKIAALDASREVKVAALEASRETKFNALEKSMELKLEALATLRETKLTALEKDLTIKIEALENSRETKVLALEKGILAAIDSAEKAAQKAEHSGEKRFEVVEEMRTMLHNQAAMFLPREEYNANHTVLLEKMDVMNKNLTTSIDDLRAFKDASTGVKAGLNMGWGILLGLVTLGSLVYGFTRGKGG